MTDTLRRAVAKAETLSAPDQDALAAILLDEIESEARWDELFARPESGSILAAMADQAMREHDAGQSRSMDDVLGTD